MPKNKDDIASALNNDLLNALAKRRGAVSPSEDGYSDDELEETSKKEDVVPIRPDNLALAKAALTNMLEARLNAPSKKPPSEYDAGQATASVAASVAQKPSSPPPAPPPMPGAAKKVVADPAVTKKGVLAELLSVVAPVAAHDGDSIIDETNSSTNVSLEEVAGAVQDMEDAVSVRSGKVMAADMFTDNSPALGSMAPEAFASGSNASVAGSPVSFSVSNPEVHRQMGEDQSDDEYSFSDDEHFARPMTPTEVDVVEHTFSLDTTVQGESLYEVKCNGEMMPAGQLLLTYVAGTTPDDDTILVTSVDYHDKTGKAGFLIWHPSELDHLIDEYKSMPKSENVGYFIEELQDAHNWMTIQRERVNKERSNLVQMSIDDDLSPLKRFLDERRELAQSSIDADLAPMRQKGYLPSAAKGSDSPSKKHKPGEK